MSSPHLPSLVNSFLSLDSGYNGFPLLDFFNALNVSRTFAENKQLSQVSLVQLLVSYWLTACGGTICVALLLGQPPGWLTDDVVTTTAQRKHYREEQNS